MNQSDRNESAHPWSRLQQPGWVALSLVLVAVVGIAAYANSFDVPFTFDDEQAIATNDIIKELSRFSLGQGLHYNPRRILGYFTLALNYRYGGLDVFGYHAVNLVIHLANALLVFALATLTLKTPFFRQDADRQRSAPFEAAAGWSLLPLIAALLFVAHPVQTQAVTYVVQRFASLATLFYLAAVVCYLKGRLACAPAPQPEQGALGPAAASRGAALFWFLLTALMSALALSTKEIAVTLPAALVLCELSFFGADRGKLVRIFGGAAALGVLGLILLLASRGLGLFATLDSVSRETQDISRLSYLLTQTTVVLHYLGLLFLPLNQQVVYDWPLRHSLGDPGVLFSSLVLGALVALACWIYLVSGRRGAGLEGARALWLPSAQGRKLLRIAAFGLVWFFLTLSVESGIIPIRDVIFEHRLYLATPGFFLALAALALAYLSERQLVLLAGASAVLVLALSGATYQRNQTWRDPVRLWRDNAAKAPGNVAVWQNLGVALHRKKDFEGAIKAYQYCLLFKEIDPEIYNNLGAANASVGKVEEAAQMFRTSLRLNPLQWSTYLNLGTIYVMMGNYAAAEGEFQSAQRLAPQRMEVYYHQGDLYERQGRFQEAEAKYRQAVTMDPAYSQAWKGLASVTRAQGRAAEAAEHSKRGASLEQKGGDVYFEVGK